MKHLVFVMATLAALAIGLPARGADMPLKPPPAATTYNWTGVFLGGHLGYLWGAARLEEDGFVVDDHALINGAIGGVLAGFNWQNGAMVLGVEGDIGFSDARGADETEPIPNTFRISSTVHGRGRIGVAMDNNLLLFLAAGLGAANFTFTPGDSTASAPGGHFVGPSAGAGFEYGLTPEIIGRVELIYDDYGSKSYVTATDSYRIHLIGRTVRGALTVKFWSDVR